ncbi:MAG TPA: DM13 domain-containing protein [Ferruginibacter sp.]|nr:DM13 domain-containing protein [Ferruginibacter sp.]HMP20523.1 DM13 domain-containing protein [Ferruginibacter sp.]
MKYTGIVLLCTIFCACTKNKIETIAPPAPLPDGGTAAYRGVFYPTPGITVAGTVKVLKDTIPAQLLLDSFSISSGPDLKVYLSKNDYPSQFVNLGALLRFTGNSSYSIPVGTNLSDYNYVLIHCQQYNHLFAVAPLVK